MIEKIYEEFNKFKTPLTIDRDGEGRLIIIENGQPLILLMEFLQETTSDKSEFGEFMNMYNSIFTKNGKPGTKKGDSKSKRQFSARRKEGFTMDDFQKALLALHQDKWHIQGGETSTPYYYATPEYITRADKLNKFKDLSPETPKIKMVY
jgi:hypothetical protein